MRLVQLRTQQDTTAAGPWSLDSIAMAAAAVVHTPVVNTCSWFSRSP